MPNAIASVAFDPEGAVLSIRLAGEIDIASAPPLRADLFPHLVLHRGARLVVQLDDVTFFGADGIRLLHELRERSGSPIELRCRAGAPARRVVELFCKELTAG